MVLASVDQAEGLAAIRGGVPRTPHAIAVAMGSRVSRHERD
jgi:hypothetical protein